MRGVLALGVASARRLQGVQASHRLSLASHIVRPSSLKERVKIWATLFLLTKISRCKRSSGRRRRLARASANGRCEARTWAKPGGGDRARADPLPHLADA